MCVSVCVCERVFVRERERVSMFMSWYCMLFLFIVCMLSKLLILRYY